jgi:hypothetical protein
MNDGSDGDRGGSKDRSDWIDRHLGKVLVFAAAICILGLVGRALTG